MTAPIKTKKELILDVSLKLFSEKGFKYLSQIKFKKLGADSK